MSKHPVKPAKYILSHSEQDKKIVSEALSLLDDYNKDFGATRRLTPLMVEKIVKRSLKKDLELSYSNRRYRALKELSNFALLLQKNKSVVASADNRDLLPIAHPQSSRFHMVNDYSIQVAHARYWSDDPMITDSMVPSLIASAFTAPPRSGERDYALARLSAMGAHKVPRGALVAAFKDGANDGFWRMQLRDAKGQFAEMGRGLRFRVRRARNGVVNWLMGDTVSTNVTEDAFTIETPDGKLYKGPANGAESVKAIIDDDQNKNGYSQNPANTKAGDVVVDENDLIELEAPDGWQVDPDYRPGQDEVDYYGTDEDLGVAYRTGNYQAVKYQRGQNAAAHKFELQQSREAKGEPVVAYGKGEDGELDPELPLYFLKRNEPNARTFAAVQSWKDVQNLIQKDEARYADGEPVDPERPQNQEDLAPTELKVGDRVNLNNYRNRGARIKGKPRANALKVREYNRMLKKYREEGAEFPIDPRREHFILDDGTIIDTETGVVLRDNQGRSNPDAWKEEPEAPAVAPQEDAPEAEAPVTPQDDQVEEVVEDFEEAPEGFYDLDRGTYIPEGAVDGQTSPDYTDDPAELAQRYSAAQLTQALRQGLKMGVGFLPFEGGDELVNAEAIYNALKEQGVDADRIVDAIYRGENGEARPEVLPDEEANLGEDTPEAPVAEEADDNEMPALLDGLSEEEKEAVQEDGDVSEYLSENKVYEDDEVPEGYYKIKEDNFQLIPEDVPEDAPDEVQLAPVDIARDFSPEGLKRELQRALAPEGNLPGYGILAYRTPEDELYLVNVPAEAIRDALKLQDEDVEAFIDEIYAEGFRGQEADEPSPEQIDDAVEGENIEEAEAPSPEEAEEPEAPAEPEEAPETENISVADVRVGDVIRAKDGSFKEVVRKSPTDSGPIFDYADGRREMFDFEDEVDRQIADAPEAEEAPDAEQAGFQFRDVGEMTDAELDREHTGLKVEYRRYTEAFLNGDTVPKERAELVRERIQELEDEYRRRREEVQAESQPVNRDELNEEEKQELDATVVEPYRAKVAVKDLEPGDVAVRDGEAFVIEEIEIPDVGTADQDNKGVNRVNVKGYHPGHQSQDRNWFANLEIEVIREAQVPAKGDREPLIKPELADYGPLKKQDGKWGLRNKGDQERYDNDYADYVANVAAAAGEFNDPTALQGRDTPEEPQVANDKPEDGPFIVTDVAENLQAGDISRKDHFVITRVFRDANTKPGSVSIEGYYPGYGLQRKEWKVDTPIEVVRGVPENELPEMGEGSLHRPAGRGPRGGWYPIDDPELNREHQEKLQEARDRWVEPENLPVVAAQDAKGEEQLQEPPKQPKAPFLPAFPPFRGFFADLAKRVGRDWKAFKEGLKDREIIVFDFETTGVMPEDGNEPYQIGYRKIVNGKEVATGGIYFQPGRSIKGTYAENNAKGPDGNPLTDEFLDKQMTQEEAFQWIKDKFGDNALLVAHNARFDMEILDRKFKEFGIDFSAEGVADTMAMASEFYKDGKLNTAGNPVDENGKPRKKNLKAVSEWLGVKLDNWHDADADVAAASEIFTKLIDRGIDNGEGLSALDADERKAEFDRKNEAVQPAIEAYDKAVADYFAKKAVFDAAAGKDVDLDEVQKSIENSRPVPEGPIDNGQPLDEEGVEAEEPQADLVDVEADSIFQGGKMRIAVKEFANNPIRVEQLFRGEIKVENLRPGDFVRPKRDNDEFWQVVAIRAGEDFDITGNRVVVYVQNDEGQQLRVRWRRNAFLDEVRRPRNRADLVAGENDPVANPEPERKPNQALAIPVQVEAGQGFVRMRKEGDDVLAEAILNDEDGNKLYNITVRRADAAEAEEVAKKAVREFGRILAEDRRKEAGQPEPQEQSIAVGDAPNNAGEIPIVEQIDNLPFGKGENEVTPKPDKDGVKYESNARVMDEDGEVQAQVVEDFQNENAALEGGQKNAEQAAQDIADRIADRNRLASEGRGRRNLPEIPDKYRRQVFIRLLAGLYADADGNPLAVGDRVIHTNPKKAAQYGEGVVVNKVQGKIGGLQRAGVVYVDYVIVEYPDGSRRKFASRFQRHQDADIAKQRFQAEDRINWMNEDQMKEALEERRKKNRKNKQDPAVDAADAQAEQIAEEVKEATEAPAPSEAASEPTQIPDLPRAKTLKLAQAKENVRNIAKEILDMAGTMSDEELNEAMEKYTGIGGLGDRRTIFESPLRAAVLQVNDRRQRKTWEMDLHYIIQRAQTLGRWDLARRIKAAANLKDAPELRPQGEEFNNKIQNLEDNAVEYIGVIQRFKRDIVGGRDLGPKLEKGLVSMLQYPDPYNADFRRGFNKAKEVLDDMVQMNNITNDVYGDTKLRELADLVNQIGPLPALPKYRGNEDAEREFKVLDDIKAPIAGNGYRLDDFKANKVPGFRYEFNISDGINEVIVINHEGTGRKFVIKEDGVSLGINAEEMVAQIYRDLGFAQPAFRVIDPDLRGRVGIMELVEDGFFGLEGPDQIEQFSDVRRGDLRAIAPEHQAELLNFVVANGIVGNGDRHRRNVMLGKNADGFYRIIPIDNGLAMANGAFAAADANIERGDYLGMLPEAFINGGFGNPNVVAALAFGYVNEIGEDQAKNQIVEFAQRMRERAALIDFIDSRINEFLIARADYVIANPGRILRAIERAI